jgi:hypothetical protein
MIEAASHGEVRFEGLLMLDPRAILFQASQGAAPSGWAVFTKRRGRLTGFLRGTSDDPVTGHPSTLRDSAVTAVDRCDPWCDWLPGRTG